MSYLYKEWEGGFIEKKKAALRGDEKVTAGIERFRYYCKV